MWFKREIFPIGASVWTRGPQMMVLFGKGVESLGDVDGVVLLEEVGH